MYLFTLWYFLQKKLTHPVRGGRIIILLKSGRLKKLKIDKFSEAQKIAKLLNTAPRFYKL